MQPLYLPKSIRLPVTSSRQVVFGVRAAETVEDQQHVGGGARTMQRIVGLHFLPPLLQHRPVL